MAEPDIKSLLSKEVAGFPVWVWGIIIGAGIAAAYFIPKLIGGAASTDSSGTSPSGGAFAGQVPAGCVMADSSGACLPGYTQMQLSDGTVLCCPVSATGGLGGGGGGGSGGGGGGGGGGNPPPTIVCKRKFTVPNYPANDPRYGWAHIAQAAHTSVSTLIRCNPGVVPPGGTGHATAGEVLCVQC
jgi:hypothetical protein